MEDYKQWLIDRNVNCCDVDLLQVQGLAILDKHFPSFADWREYKNYLAGNNAPYSFIEAFENSWEKFTNERLGARYEQERIRECDTLRTKTA